MIGWLLCLLIGWLVDWLVGWLVGWSSNLTPGEFIENFINSTHLTLILIQTGASKGG